MKLKRVEIDSGRGENGLVFSLEEKIKKYEKGIDYEIDKIGNYYTILSERLKKVIWPNDYFWYNESVVAIDRQGKIQSWRIAAENPREPYKRFKEGGLKEIMSDFENNHHEKEKKVNEQIGTAKNDLEVKKDTITSFSRSSEKSENLMPWIIGGSLFLASLFLFWPKKALICRRKSKKNFENKQ